MQTNCVTSSVRFLVVAGWLAALGSAASADSVKFYSGTTGYTPPPWFNASGSVYEATATRGTAACTGACSALQNLDRIQQLITFATDAFNTVSITLLASAPHLIRFGMIYRRILEDWVSARWPKAVMPIRSLVPMCYIYTFKSR